MSRLLEDNKQQEGKTRNKEHKLQAKTTVDKLLWLNKFQKHKNNNFCSLEPTTSLQKLRNYHISFTREPILQEPGLDGKTKWCIYIMKRSIQQPLSMVIMYSCRKQTICFVKIAACNQFEKPKQLAIGNTINR